MLLEALGLPAPQYGHLPLLLGPSGAPLSKRDGAASLGDLRTQGYLPGALRNYLVRLGHACTAEGWLEVAELAGHFDLARSSRSAAHFDEAQLRHWQREAVGRAGEAELLAWLGERLQRLPSSVQRSVFVAAVRGNLLFPSDVEPLLDMVSETAVAPDGAASREMVSAGAPFFAAALAEWRTHAPDFRAWTRAVGAATGRKGAALYMPLRAALTGRTHGPELAPLVALIGAERVAERIAAAGDLASAP
jgi:glutamyl-tRNA synthetase